MKKIQKTAGIYNRWLFTLGGGEQVTFAYAEALRDLGYKTEFLTHREVNIAMAESKMNVNLNKINIKYIPLVSSQELSGLSSKYDIFINTSYLDYFPNASKYGILSVFFPGEIYLSFWEYCKRYILLPSFKKFFIYPTQFQGFQGDEYSPGILYKWLGHSSSIFLSNSSIKSISLEIYFPSFCFSAAEKICFKCNGQVIYPSSHRHISSRNSVIYTFNHDSAIKVFTIEKPKRNEEKIALITLTIPSLRYALYNVFKYYFPKWEMRLHGGPTVTTLSDLQSYNKIITISKFCQYWIDKYWAIPSEILYPPVNVNNFYVASKKNNWITHIGRFFVTGHSKKQLELIRVFKDLIDTNKLDSSWELHFIGSVHEGKSHQEYFQSCIAEAENYPIYFHIAIPFTELRDILSKSKIYWHATGLDENPNKQPILMEHFGITTVEAMASGCVPIVINAGGQPEIIALDTGFIWNTRDELKEFTVRVANNESLRIKIMQNAIKRSKQFSIESFKKRFATLIEN